MSRRLPRSRARALVAAVSALAVIAAAGVPSGAFAASSSFALHTAGVVPDSTHSVTLITGDRVEVTEMADGTLAVGIEPAVPGAGARTYESGGDLFVLPESALPYTASGVLDPDLFNVSLLIRNGYDDASVDATPVIAVLAGGPSARSVSAIPALGLGLPLESVDGAAGAAPHDTAVDAWSALTAGGQSRRMGGARLAGGVEALHLDGRVRATLDSSVPYVGAPEAWAEGYEGDGVTVAVLDTGYDDTHPDLAGRVLVEASRSFVPGEEVATDTQGHGTHVAATVAGTGAASGGLHRGVADGARLLVGKVLDSAGYGRDSWIISGMQWAGENAGIVSMSLGSQEASDGTDLMAEALDRISADTDALFVVAAGNSGAPETIGSPGAAASALTVGSVDDPTGALSGFSSQGPTVRTGALKPELTGPGNEVTAARSADSPGEGSYVTFSGTSMATPHVAGAAALVREQHPEYTADQVRAVLLSTAADVGLSSYQGGAGVLDAASAVDATMIADGSGDFGMLRWGEDPAPVSRTITYANRGDAAVTVALEAALEIDGSVDGNDGVGDADPSRALTVDVDSLLIPAGATGAATMTLDPALVPTGAQLSGALVASVDGEPVARTALGGIVESERYDLSLRATGFDGSPVGAYVWVADADTGSVSTIAVAGDQTVRLPGGRYSVMAFLDLDRTPDSRATVLVGDPEIVLDKDASVALDARAAREVTVDVGADDLEPAFRRMNFRVGDFAGSAIVGDGIDALFAQPTAAPDGAMFAFTTRWRLQRPVLTLSAGGEALDVSSLAGSTPLDGAISAAAVDAGTGREDDFAAVDVRGRVAVVTRSDALTGTERAANALAAGAAMLVVVNDEDSEFTDWVGSADGLADVPLPVAGVSGVEGRRVLARLSHAAVQITGRGVPHSSVVYDVALHSDEGIPEELTHAPEDLARVDTRYYGTPTTVGEFRYDFAPGDSYSSGFLLRTTTGLRRTEYVDAERLGWYQEATAIEPGWTVRDVRRTYSSGQRVSTSYFGGVVRPYIGPGYWAPFRQGPNAQVNVPSWADGGNALHTGAFDVFSASPDRKQSTEVFIDGTLVASSPYQAASADDIPSASSEWRVVNTAEQSSDFLRSSSRTRTEWSFRSAGAVDDEEKQLLPMLQASYDVTLDAAGRAGATRRTGVPVLMKVEIGHVGGAVGAAPMSRATLQVRAADGRWRSAPLIRTGDGAPAGAGPAPVDGFPTGRAHVARYTALLPVPGAGGWVDLRLEGRDGAGNTVRQEIERALEIAPARSWRPGNR